MARNVAPPPAAGPPMLRPAEGLRLILEHTRELEVEQVPVSADLAGRFLAADVAAGVSLPPFATSAMDGYAVRVADLRPGSGVPIAFRLGAGDRPQPLPPAAASGIATGAPIPAGADAVVPIEDAREENGTLFADPPTPGAHIRPQGGDVRAGEVVGRAGTLLSPALLAAISATGVAHVAVARRPRVAAVATGDELVPPGRPLEPGQIYESNLTSIVAQARSAGADVIAAEIVADDRDATREAFARAISADIVISSGGVSVGPHDHVKPALLELGVREVFWRLAHKPGKPLWFGVASTGALVFGLPGNPVSSLVCFELFVRPALAALQHGSAPPRAVARLAEPVRRLTVRDHAVRCRLRASADGMVLEPAGAQDSHMIAHAAGADAIALIAAGDGEAPAGTLVEYLPLQ